MVIPTNNSSRWPFIHKKGTVQSETNEATDLHSKKCKLQLTAKANQRHVNGKKSVF